MKRLAQSAVTTGAGTLLYTVPTGYRADITNTDIANTSSSAISFSLHLVPVAGSAATGNMLFPAISIPGNTLIQWTGVQSLTAGQFVQGIGSAAGVTVTMTGDEIRDKL